MFDATFWVAISFFLFLTLLIYKKVPKIILDQLDAKISELKSKISEAENLKSNSEKLLSGVQSKLSKSENETAEIIKKRKKLVTTKSLNLEKKTKLY